MKIFQPGGGSGVTNNGTGIATRVAYWVSATQIGGDANFFYNPTTDLVSIGKPTPTYMLDVLEDINTDTFYRIDGTFVLGQNSLNSNLAVGSAAGALITSGLSAFSTNLFIGTSLTPPNTSVSQTVFVGQGVPTDGPASTFTDCIGLGIRSIGTDEAITTNIDSLICIGVQSCVVIGNSVSDTIVVGNRSHSNTTGSCMKNIIIGHDSFGEISSSQYIIGIGNDNYATNTNYLTVIGHQNSLSTSGDTPSILIGNTSNLTSANVCVIGGSLDTIDNSIYSLHLGRGEFTRDTNMESGVTYTATKAFDADIAGIDVNIAGGQSTGGADGGSVYIQTSKAGSAGSTLNTYNNVVQFNAVGNIRAFSLHNNATAQGTSSEQDIRSGTYTPTLTNTTNVSASTPREAQWLRLGNVVTVSGQLDIDPTAAGAVLLGISLPVASDFSTVFQLAGSAGSMTAAGESIGIEADATNNRASLRYIAVDTTNHAVTYTFTYQVI